MQNYWTSALGSACVKDGILGHTSTPFALFCCKLFLVIAMLVLCPRSSFNPSWRQASFFAWSTRSLLYPSKLQANILKCTSGQVQDGGLRPNCAKIGTWVLWTNLPTRAATPCQKYIHNTFCFRPNWEKWLRYLLQPLVFTRGQKVWNLASIFDPSCLIRTLVSKRSNTSEI